MQPVSRDSIPPVASAPSERDNKRWVLGFGLATLLAANLVLLGLIAAGAWSDFNRPANAPQDLRTLYETYRDRVDSLSKLVAALIGLSALYSTAIGITAYLSAQIYIERSQEALKEARERSAAQLSEFQKLFPTFNDINQSIPRLISLLAALVPDVERLADNEEKLTPEVVQRVQYYERSIAFFEFLKIDGALDSAEVYRRLGRFYRALYEKEKNRLKSRKTPLGQKRKPAIACTVEELRAYELLDKAQFYIDYLLWKDQGNFAALNEKALLIQEIDGSDRSPRALEFFERSVEANGKQQRALYRLGYIHLKSNDETELALAEKAFSQALETDNWEKEKSSPERRYDLLYNRACARSKLAMVHSLTPTGAGTKELRARPPGNKAQWKIYGMLRWHPVRRFLAT